MSGSPAVLALLSLTLLSGAAVGARGGADGPGPARKERSLGEVASELARDGAFSRSDARSTQKIEREIRPLLREVQGLTGRLDALARSYPDLRDLEAARAERLAARDSLERKRARLMELQARFVVEMGIGVSEGMRQAFAPERVKKPDEMLQRFLAASSLSQDDQIALRAAQKCLKDEAGAFAAAEESLARGRALTRAGAVCAACLLLAGGIAYALAARSRRAARASVLPAAPSLPAVSEPAAIGGSYRLVRELEDGKGRAFQALDLKTDRTVVLKRLRDELAQSPRELERFLAEAGRVASLEHANIVKLRGLVKDVTGAYLVFEHFPGTSLDHLLGTRGRLSLAAAAGIIGQAAAAVDYAHSRGVLHQGLSPSNILVDEGGSAKVADFSLAQRARLTAARVSGAVFPGALAYLAPEQELGEACRESDVYSLAACLYEAVTGRPPFQGDHLAQKRAMAFAPPSAAGLPAALDAVISKALQPDPTLRYRRAAELIGALRGVVPAG